MNCLHESYFPAFRWNAARGEKGLSWAKLAAALLGLMLAAGASWAQNSSAATKSDLAPGGSLPLAGIKICLDPGHGGGETGAVGGEGTRESDINLKVANFLREQLEKAGAAVVMTRTSDASVKIGRRAEINKAQNTDLFVSIHHNANAQADRAVNRSEVFYHWKDDGGPSEDAARALMRVFRADYGLPGGKAMMCWAYGVLRENAYPAILAEAFYLSNPQAEKMLKTEAGLRKEADSYFRAILDYFKGGRPEVILVPRHDPAARRVAQAIVLERDGLSLLDPQRVRAELDGVPAGSIPWRLFYQADFALLFADLPKADLAGSHTLTLAIRNLGGNTSKLARRSLLFEKAWRSPAAPPQARFDEAKILGRPRPGAAPAALAGAALLGQQIRDVFAVANRDGAIRLDAAERITPDPHYASALGYWTRQADLAASKTVVLEPMFRGALHGKKIIVDAEGGGDESGPVAQGGTRACDVNLEAALYLESYLKQAGADVSLTRERDMSMDNVSRVRFGLERDPDVFLSIGHRLPEPGLNEAPGANMTRLGHRWEDGGTAAKKLVFHLRELLGTGPPSGDGGQRNPLPGEIQNWSSWEVMHAAQKYTAVHVCPLMFDAPGAESRLNSTAGTRKEALALLYGLLDYFGLDDRKMASVEGVVQSAAGGAPLGDALVWLDDTLVAQTEPDGRFLFKFLEPGPRTIRVMRQGYAPATQAIELKMEERLRQSIGLNPVSSPGNGQAAIKRP